MVRQVVESLEEVQIVAIFNPVMVGMEVLEEILPLVVTPLAVLLIQAAVHGIVAEIMLMAVVVALNPSVLLLVIVVV